MENRARIAMASNRKIVQDGLNRRRMESQLDAFEEEMIQRVNENCAAADWKRHCDNTANIERELRKARILARAAAKSGAQQDRKDTILGGLIFVIYGIVIAFLACWTYLPVWGAIMYIAVGALFLVLYLIDVHGLPSMENKK